MGRLQPLGSRRWRCWGSRLLPLFCCRNGNSMALAASRLTIWLICAAALLFAVRGRHDIEQHQSKKVPECCDEQGGGAQDV